jgi:hypothetical protein
VGLRWTRALVERAEAAENESSRLKKVVDDAMLQNGEHSGYIQGTFREHSGNNQGITRE